jgi:hypothetical protein
MTRDQANDAAEKLQGLFPQITPTQVVEWATTFQRYDHDVVCKAISAHHEVHTFIDNANLVESIRNVMRKREAAITDSWRRDQAVRDRWARIEELVSKLSDDEIKKLMPSAIETFPEHLREFFAARNPRRSKPLMDAIYQVLEAA